VSAWSDCDEEIVAAFLDYVEGAVAADDRYGPVGRCKSDDESIIASRFEAFESCWLEVAVHREPPRITVGFLTGESSVEQEIENGLADLGGTLKDLLAQGFQEAGLKWNNPPIERLDETGQYAYYVTPVDLDELRDLELEEHRAKTIRMLEGYLITFGPAIELTDDEDE